LRPAKAPQLPLRAERLPSVDQGAGWFDYRFPAPPDCFIGRDTALSEIQKALGAIAQGQTALRTVQILSRSGVGKSSLLLKLAAVLPDASVTTVDARSLRAPSDVRLIVSALVESVNDTLNTALSPPRSRDEADAALEPAGTAMADSARLGVVQLDQFESTLALPAVFAAVLDLIAATTARGLPILWVLARKNDLSTTFDASSRVDLERLNNQSQAIALEDFSASEGRILLDRLSVELGRPLRAGLAEAISTFSAGFPWLHKRLCSHVLSMRDEGVSEEELLQQGLRAEDLFEEDMAGLSETDKALLRRIAAHLPATGEELARDLEAEASAERLRDRLNDFLGKKLLRLSGDVFDTYNDVFKTYLVLNQSPSVQGQWSNLLTVEVTAKPEAEFFYAEEVAKHDAAKRGYHFSTTEIRGAPAFFESYVITDESKPPCQPGTYTGEFGPPACQPQPVWFSYTAASYGALKPRGPEAFVDVNLTGELHVSKPVVIDLNSEILSGQIR
jgi:hypothetical protein